jgi:enterochelin esterase-like enzyme
VGGGSDLTGDGVVIWCRALRENAGPKKEEKGSDVSVRVSECVCETRKGAEEVFGGVPKCLRTDTNTRGGCAPQNWREMARKKMCRHKRLIFRRLAGFFTIFHPFFTPYFSHKRLSFRRLRISHRYKRHPIADFGFRISELGTQIARIYAVFEFGTQAGKCKGSEKVQGHEFETRIARINTNDLSEERGLRSAEFEKRVDTNFESGTQEDRRNFTLENTPALTPSLSPRRGSIATAIRARPVRRFWPFAALNGLIQKNMSKQYFSQGVCRRWATTGVVLMMLSGARTVLGAGEDRFYKLGPDSLPQEGVPKGTINGPFTLPSQVFAGTEHTYWVYVPAQYDAKEPAAFMVFNDGHAMIATNGDMRAQNVLDNLIWRREIPVIITVFINPGHTPEQPDATDKEWGDHTGNRPEEYNRLNDKYARVICDELMPVITNQYRISPDPDLHAIAGTSSGAIAAFTVAWERPDEFRKVISIVGSFTDIRGGYVYPENVLAADKKPIRVFFVDGVNDNRGIRKGTYDPNWDWHLQNTRLVDAMTKKGYDINYTWGIGLHGQKQGGAALPEMMRWLWRDYPRSADPTNMVERSFREAVSTNGN